MTRFLFLIVAEVALLLLVPLAFFGWLGKRNPRFAYLARRYNTAITWLLAGLLAYLFGWPLLQALLR